VTAERPQVAGHGYCSHCKLVKLAEEFYKNSARPNGLQAWCKTCTRERSKDPDRIAYQQKHGREYYKTKGQADRRTSAGREGQWKAALKYKYGLTVDDYNRLLAEQDGRCAICRGKSVKNRRLCVDHDHACCPGGRSCGKCIRGLLCNQCNRKILGYWLQETVKGTIQALETARRLVSYLEKSAGGDRG